ncbi:hypothetical protein PPERSA_02183 [Pseudocohnilembus persalinus]|uniref:Uncharacterized protein n=1 Tax=Pseudocohnilembus persalinus TaxID=266149 RepID=A0A0V0QFW1_PSEPJ|nr:hypothetical protein PPERSA_02183 [Pseudocohnilembus persalinus]|eukprot:KRX01087.1 hypothetical protein PPERSA_02183 [Pseudocohnilembus persalinus]
MELAQNLQNKDKSPKKSILQNKENRFQGGRSLESRHINFANEGTQILHQNSGNYGSKFGRNQEQINKQSNIQNNQNTQNSQNNQSFDNQVENMKIVSPQRRSLFSHKPFYMAKKLELNKQIQFLNNMENLKNKSENQQEKSGQKKFHLLKGGKKTNNNGRQLNSNISEVQNEEEEEQSNCSMGESELLEKSQEEDASISQLNETQKNDHLARKLIKTTENFFKPGSFEENWETRQKNKENLFKESEIYQKMPVINEDGSIPKHKIVGKPEWYIKQYMLKNNQTSNIGLSALRGNKGNISQQFSINLCGNNNNINNNLNDDAKSLKSQNSMMMSNIQNNQKQPLGSQRSLRSQTFNNQTGKSPLISSLKRNKFDKNQNILNKELLTKEVEKVLERVENNRLASREFNKRIKNQNDSLRDVLLMEKDEKIFQNFNKYQLIWKGVIQNQTQRINRNYENSIIFAAESHRSKQETIKALEALKSEKEKLGDKYWEMTLRHPNAFKDKNISNIEANDVNTNENAYAKYEKDPLQAFKGSKRVETQLEIIRKPRGNILKGKFEGVSNFTTFKSDEYFRNKFSLAAEDKIGKIRHLDDREYENMEIQGKSKLETEINSLLEGTGENQMYIKKNVNYNNQQENEPADLEEIIEINYDKNRLTDMPGYSFKKFNIKY